MYKAVYQLNDIEKHYMYLEDKDYREIAETLGISEVNARVKMNRIKGKLKKILNLKEYERAGFIKRLAKNKDSFEQYQK
jgi:DNA-directed RNA polymerase specialized sigma subunit